MFTSPWFSIVIIFYIALKITVLYNFEVCGKAIIMLKFKLIFKKIEKSDVQVDLTETNLVEQNLKKS